MAAGSGMRNSPRLSAGSIPEQTPHAQLEAGKDVLTFERVGNRVILHSGVVIGADGYGFATEGGKHHKIPQVGGVVTSPLADPPSGTRDVVELARRAGVPD